MNVSDAVICRLKKEGSNFEILVDCDKAMGFKHGKASLDDALVTDDIFKDVKKGEHASEHDLKKLLGTDSKREACEIILKNGDVQLTAEYKNRLREEKKWEEADKIREEIEEMGYVVEDKGGETQVMKK